MTFKKLLLGTALALGFGGAAQAADLAVAEPVDYVKVCDAFGNTYWYSPGTDTCLSITGYVRLDVRIMGNVGGAPPFPAIANAAASNWKFLTKAGLAIAAKSMTEWGPLVGYMRFVATSDNGLVPPGVNLPAFSGINQVATLEEAYASLGNFLVGYTENTFAYGYNVAFNAVNVLPLLNVFVTDQIRFGFAVNGWGVAVAAQDPRDVALATNRASMAFPDIAARVTGSGANGILSGQLSAYYGARAIYNVWGAQLGVTLKFGPNAASSLRLVGAVGNSNEIAGPLVAATFGGLTFGGAGTYWSAFASFQHVFGPRWNASIFGAAASGPGSGQAAVNAAFVAVFTPVTNFSITGEVGVTRADTAAAPFIPQGTIRFTRAF